MEVMVDQVKCKEESDEIGADDIYIITFRGRTTAPFNSNVGVKLLGSYTTGSKSTTDRVIAMFQSDAVYVVMLVEKDHDRDIAGDEVLGIWRSQTDLVWKATMLSQLSSGNWPPSEAQKNAAAQAIGNTMNGLASIYMSFPKGDDDIIDSPKRLKISSGEKPVLHFVSPPSKEDAHYDITFKVA